MKKEIDKIIDRCGFELKHNPNPKQSDIDYRSSRCIEEGIELGFQYAIDLLRKDKEQYEQLYQALFWVDWLEERKFLDLPTNTI